MIYPAPLPKRSNQPYFKGNVEDLIEYKFCKMFILYREGGSLALGGGLIRAIQDNTPKTHLEASAIIFSGSRVNSASVILPRNVRKADTVTQYLKKVTRGSWSPLPINSDDIFYYS